MEIASHEVVNIILCPQVVNMDDPLIGLTIYNTTSTCDGVSHTDNGRSETVPLKTGNDEKGIDDVGEECFPCLPSIPDDQQRQKMRTFETSTGDGGKERSTTAPLDPCRTDHEDPPQPVTPVKHQISQPKHFWLMRLFQSNLFDMSIAIGYLFNSKDPNVQSYLGSRLFVSIKCDWFSLYTISLL